MRRRILMAILAVGAVSGYAMGFSHLHRACQAREAWRSEVRQEQRAADCVEHAPVDRGER